MFDRNEELNNIMTFRPHDIIKAMLQTLSAYELKQVRSQLDPHFTDQYNPSLDPFFVSTTCRLCGEAHVINRKAHFHYQCAVVKDLRDRSNDLHEFIDMLEQRANG